MTSSVIRSFSRSRSFAFIESASRAYSIVDCDSRISRTKTDDSRFLKGFNHLVAATLAADPIVEGGHRVVFLSSDDEDATAPVAALAKQLGFAPVKLGKLNEGGALVHARGRTWGPLIFQDLFKKEQ